MFHVRLISNPEETYVSDNCFLMSDKYNVFLLCRSFLKKHLLKPVEGATLVKDESIAD